MPIFYKAINMDLSKIKKIPLNFKMHAGCPDCGKECVHDFNAEPLSYPEKDGLLSVDFSCPACAAEFKVPAKIQNMRVVLAYDPDLKRK